MQRTVVVLRAKQFPVLAMVGVGVDDTTNGGVGSDAASFSFVTKTNSSIALPIGYRWGSCGYKGDLYFHWRVAMLPRSMIEYLAIHEMVHLIEPHHNHTFWDRVEQILPAFEERKRWLAENGTNYDL